MLQLLQHTPNLALREAMVTGLEVEGEGEEQRIQGVRTYFGSVYAAQAVVLTAGTFLGGRIWVGHQSMAAGRAGEQAAEGLTETLQSLGLHTDRLKPAPLPGWTDAALPWISWKNSPAMPPTASFLLIPPLG
jgi:tRNA uridine 5-carboxymethylaminomethyl modification enzyme